VEAALREELAHMLIPVRSARGGDCLSEQAAVVFLCALRVAGRRVTLDLDGA
jgi:hypothetical protein